MARRRHEDPVLELGGGVGVGAVADAVAAVKA